MSFTENQGDIVSSAQEVQSSQNKPKWVLFGYASEESELVKVIEKGEGFLATALSHFKPDLVLYLLIGVETIEEGDYKLIKRLLVTWVGPEVKPLHKARSSQHRVLLYDLIKPHVKLAGEYQALSMEDLTEEKLRGKVSGAKVEESDEERLKKAAELDASKRRKGSASPAAVFQPTSGSGASSFSWADEEAAKTTIEELRKPDSALNWVLFDYQDKTIIRMASKGSGGISQFESHLTPDACVFGVLAVKVQEGDFSTTKFLFISWAGPEVKPPVRARSSQHRVALYGYVDKIVTLAGELQALSKDDFSESIILSKLTGSRQLGDSKEKVSSKSTTKTEAASFDFHFADEESVKSLLTNFREKKNWVVFGYDSGHGDKIVVLGSGSGGLEEVTPFLKEEDVVYFVLGVNTPEGEYSLIKYILVTWVGPSVKPMFKARSSQHRVPLYKYVNAQVPLSGESQALSKDDLSNDVLMQKLLGSRATTSGDSKATPSKRTVGSNEFRFADEEGTKAVVQELRKDGSKTTWVVLGYQDSDDINVIQKGGGDVSNFSSLLSDDSINYVVTGVNLKEGEYTITKYILITWVGKDVKPMAKARSSQHRNPLYKYVNTHCQLGGEIQILSREDLTNQALVEKLLGAKTVQGEHSSPVTQGSPSVSKRSTAGHASAIQKDASGEIKVSFSNEEDAKAALEKYKNSQSNWVLFGYELGKNDIVVKSAGSGNLEELKASFKDDLVAFAVYAYITPEGDYKVRKNVFISWVGPDVKPLMKARSSQDRLPLYKYIHKLLGLHGEIQILAREALTDNILLEKITGARVQ